jgi:hypothetical protein
METRVKRLDKMGSHEGGDMIKERCLHDYDETVIEKAYWNGYTDGYNQSMKDYKA